MWKFASHLSGSVGHRHRAHNTQPVCKSSHVYWTVFAWHKAVIVFIISSWKSRLIQYRIIGSGWVGILFYFVIKTFTIQYFSMGHRLKRARTVIGRKNIALPPSVCSLSTNNKFGFIESRGVLQGEATFTFNALSSTSFWWKRDSTRRPLHSQHNILTRSVATPKICERYIHKHCRRSLEVTDCQTRFASRCNNEP